MAQEVAVFVFSNANGISFPWNCTISPWCELSASTASCWQVLQLCCVCSEKNNNHLLFYLLGLPTANFDISPFLYWNRQGTIKTTHFLHVTHFIQLYLVSLWLPTVEDSSYSLIFLDIILSSVVICLRTAHTIQDAGLSWICNAVITESGNSVSLLLRILNIQFTFSYATKNWVAIWAV